MTEPLAATFRERFASDMAAVRIRWSGHNLSRMLRATGERPERVDFFWLILANLGMGFSRHWPGPGGVFDHGEMWSRDRVPSILVGHPYSIDDDQRAMLGELDRVAGLRVGIDDRPSHYYRGTHHVRIELIKPLKPYLKPQATRKTRSAARRAKEAFQQEFGGPPLPESLPSPPAVPIRDDLVGYCWACGKPVHEGEENWSPGEVLFCLGCNETAGHHWPDDEDD